MLLRPNTGRLTLLFSQRAPRTHLSLTVPYNHGFHASTIRPEQRRSRSPQVGTMTPVPDEDSKPANKSPFYFVTGYAGWAKRPSRPFPPPFFSPPSGSFSDPLSTHNRSRDRRPKVNGEMILGVTNGDDAMLVTENLLAANDGVGAWAQKERGHAPLWSRLIIHFWAAAAEKDGIGAASTGISVDAKLAEGNGKPDPVRYLSEAYSATKEALSPPNEWLGTTTASSALLHWEGDKPMLYVTQLGDCKVLVLRPDHEYNGNDDVSVDEQEDIGGKIIFATKEQWHYFDCPRQLGTNSPDNPEENAVLDVVDVQEGDVVLAMSDGVTDNLWEHEISANALKSLRTWLKKQAAENSASGGLHAISAEAVRFLAEELVLAARQIAEDPFAESPFMEKAVDEGLAIEGGKRDDISVVAGLVSKRDMT
jgi:protein phosphatase PTC7